MSIKLKFVAKRPSQFSFLNSISCVGFECYGLVSISRLGFETPVLRKKQYKLEYFVKDVFVLPKIHDMTFEGPGRKCIYKKLKGLFYQDVRFLTCWH